MSLLNFLEEINLSELHEVLLNQNVTLSNFVYLSKENIDELFSKVGDRMNISKAVEILKKGERCYNWTRSASRNTGTRNTDSNYSYKKKKRKRWIKIRLRR